MAEKKIPTTYPGLYSLNEAQPQISSYQWQSFDDFQTNLISADAFLVQKAPST